ncbi:TPA: hypothetical protein HA278_00630 [Candidatus Woesearchaeota archaeon]|nr:hypothetical protein [Candidatus Woesearchaeota archaeon]|tara:strand:+ start:597 stop:737 length:141 start_codon:yes stop_codon:yes gene_type:complete
MIHDHNFSLTEIENMMPWELEIYRILLNQYIQEENQRYQQAKAERG